MTTLEETIKKLNKLYSELYDSNDGFACSMIINDIEIAVKSYGRECSKASLERASDSAEITQDWGECNINTESITNPENIILL